MRKFTNIGHGALRFYLHFFFAATLTLITRSECYILRHCFGCQEYLPKKKKIFGQWADANNQTRLLLLDNIEMLYRLR